MSMRVFVGVDGGLKMPIGVYGGLWESMGVYESLWINMSIRVFMDAYGSLCTSIESMVL